MSIEIGREMETYTFDSRRHLVAVLALLVKCGRRTQTLAAGVMGSSSHWSCSVVTTSIQMRLALDIKFVTFYIPISYASLNVFL